jgi:hypothetical protein
MKKQNPALIGLKVASDFTSETLTNKKSPQEIKSTISTKIATNSGNGYQILICSPDQLGEVI